MTLEEAIKHCEQVAEKNDKIADTFDYSLKTKSDCKKCASEHRQLAEWLKELKRLQSHSHLYVYKSPNQMQGHEYTDDVAITYASTLEEARTRFSILYNLDPNDDIHEVGFNDYDVAILTDY